MRNYFVIFSHVLLRHILNPPLVYETVHCIACTVDREIFNVGKFSPRGLTRENFPH